MAGVHVSSEAMRALHRATIEALPAATGAGVVRHDDAGHVILSYVDVFGITTYRADPDAIPEPFQPRAAGLRQASASDLESTASGLVESRLLHTGLPEEIRREYGARQVATLPVPNGQGSALFVVGFGQSGSLSSTQLTTLETLAGRVVDVLPRAESAASELDRLRRLESVEKLLPSLFDVLDVREIFDRLSAITKDVLRHDFATLGILSEDLTEIQLYAQTMPSSFMPGGRMPFPSSQTGSWMYRLVDDLGTHPLENQAALKEGGRTSLRVAVRLGDKVLGALNFTSKDGTPYTSTDLSVAERIASYVALALVHQRHSEDSRRVATLRERAANLEMLSGLLTTLTGVLDIRGVFDRVSEIAQSVLPHDALLIGERSDDGNSVTIHCAQGLGPLKTPLQIDTSERRLLQDARDFKIIDDLLERPDHATSPGIRAGMRSMLVVSIRVEGRQYGGLGFYAKEPKRFTPDDVLVAGRIADHVALALSHQRLAEQARLNEQLRARSAQLDLLDQLLASVVKEGELPAIFDRISSTAQKAIAHDALMLLVRLPDGRRARVYASWSPGMVFPEVVDVPPALLSDPRLEFDLVDDLAADPNQQHLWTAQHGFRSTLRLPIHLDDQFVGGLSFLSKIPGHYKPSDVAVARRITDHIALSFARERGARLLRRADEATQRASKLESRVRELTEELDARTGYRRVVGESKEWRQVLTQATQVSATDATVLLLGESGTGKEVVARFVHRASQRSGGPFLALNCAALPEQLLEAELFGYERGAFTGAMQSKPGQLEQAAGGTLFLDEVGEMSLAAQAKFLRVLQEREFQRIGGTRVLKTDARIVAATNRDLERAIMQGQFREDLYYRLNVFAIHLPALRERRDDVLPLSEAFLVEIGRGLGRPPAGISRDARQLLSEYHWPGNVRELRNILERAAILCEGGLITADHLALKVLRAPAAVSTPAPATPLPAAPSEPEAPQPAPAGDLQSLERGMIEQALQTARFNKSKAAKALGLTRTQLYVRMRKYGLE